MLCHVIRGCQSWSECRPARPAATSSPAGSMHWISVLSEVKLIPAAAGVRLCPGRAGDAASRSGRARRQVEGWPLHFRTHPAGPDGPATAAAAAAGGAKTSVLRHVTATNYMQNRRGEPITKQDPAILLGMACQDGQGLGFVSERIREFINPVPTRGNGVPTIARRNLPTELQSL